MADVGREQHLLGARAGQQQLAVAHGARLELAVHDYVERAVAEPRALVLGEAEAPGLLVVRRAIGNPVGMLGQAVQVRLELRAREAAAHRRAVAHEMQVVAAEVDEPLAFRARDPGVAHAPFPRHGPIENRGAGRHLVHGQRDPLAQRLQRGAHAVAGEAAAERIEPRRERVHRGSGRGFDGRCGHRRWSLARSIQVTVTGRRGAGLVRSNVERSTRSNRPSAWTMRKEKTPGEGCASVVLGSALDAPRDG